MCASPGLLMRTVRNLAPASDQLQAQHVQGHAP